MPRRPKSGSPRSKRSGVSGSAPIHHDWLAFLRALLSQSTRFLLIGGHAVAVHAEARFTEDLDVWVDPTPRNAARLRAALVEFGFGAVLPSADELVEPDRVFMLGRKPYRVDILTSISGVRFADAWRRRLTVRLGDLSVPVLSRDDLLANKHASGRTKDLFDVALLERYPPRWRCPR